MVSFWNNYDSARRLTTGELQEIQKYSFPGNVRELKNILKKMIVLSDTNIISSMGDMPRRHSQASDDLESLVSFEGNSLKQTLAAFEKSVLLSALASHSTTRALANYLDISQSQVARKLANYNLSHLLKGKKRDAPSR
jgi:TyrR family helix-turn-helix protein